MFSGAQGRSPGEAGRVLGAAVDNDQFWRLFEFAPHRVSTLGVHTFQSGNEPEGLSDIEAYR